MKKIKVKKIEFKSFFKMSMTFAGIASIGVAAISAIMILLLIVFVSNNTPVPIKNINVLLTDIIKYYIGFLISIFSISSILSVVMFFPINFLLKFKGADLLLDYEEFEEKSI